MKTSVYFTHILILIDTHVRTHTHSHIYILAAVIMTVAHMDLVYYNYSLGDRDRVSQPAFLNRRGSTQQFSL